MHKSNIRLLNNDEFNREDLKKLFLENNFPFTIDPYTCKVLIAENEAKEIVGFVVTRPRFHVEPEWIHPDYRSSLLSVRLFKSIVKLYENFKDLELYVFSSKESMTKSLIRVGFKELPHKILRKIIT